MFISVESILPMVSNKEIFYCYYALTSDLNTPSNWVSNQLQTDSGANYVKVTAQQNNSIVVTDDPFVWTPTTDEAGSDYSLVGIIVPIGQKPDFSNVTNSRILLTKMVM